jgi:hypothetical protein
MKKPDDWWQLLRSADARRKHCAAHQAQERATPDYIRSAERL